MEKIKKPFYRRWWFILIIIIAALSLLGSINAEFKKASAQKSTYTWSNSALVSLIPQPDSKYGKIRMETEDYFSMEIYKLSEENFEIYVNKCIDNGFSIDYTKQDGYYSADNEDGYSLILSYKEKEKTLNISLRAPQKSSLSRTSENILSTEQAEEENTDNTAPLDESTEEENSTDSDSVAEATDDIRPEFKTLLDDYEAFMNEYCEFMEKYTSSDDILSMTTDYMELMTKELSWIEKIDQLNEEEMNDAELKYYTEVTIRISQRLLEVSQ